MKKNFVTDVGNDTHLPKFSGFRILRFQNFRVSGFQDFRIFRVSEFLGFRRLGIRVLKLYFLLPTDFLGSEF